WQIGDFESTATVLVSSPRIDLTLDPRFKTSSSSIDQDSSVTALTRRMDTLIALAQSREVSDLAAVVLQHTPDFEGVTGEQLLFSPIRYTTNGELLKITARAATPEKAQMI